MLSQDEWFYLCLLSGATTLFGLENVPDGLDLQEARQRWEMVSGRLKRKHILTEEDEDQLYIERDYAAIAEFCLSRTRCLLAWWKKTGQSPWNLSIAGRGCSRA
ncbi:hypothetical protein GNQ08_23085 [Paenibacillus macerans]|uniref:Uncharacterized protein n=1 Tax=Paenibacillus macerans TaxID=44252 RepID=A0A6N8EYI1_PAEMA|nr:hypothetical protein [Paenibacillus macerans]MUG25256.1 hypothetical protein [Paenibacillus macerans]